MPEITTTPLADWQADMALRGKLDCRFVCPKCGNTASPSDFKRAGADPQRAVQECIGRVNRDLGGCDWAAFGLFDICPVHLDMNGEVVPVFDFAPVVPATDEAPAIANPNKEERRDP